MGCHETLNVYKRARQPEGDVPIIGIDDDFHAGDLCWLETPLNPTGEARYVLVYIDSTNSCQHNQTGI